MLLTGMDTTYSSTIRIADSDNATSLVNYTATGTTAYYYDVDAQGT